MYTKRVQIAQYGPIEGLDIGFPFEGENPKPVLLVGENGSGKSILLSFIVNGLISAKDAVYPETPEVETGRVYKLRSSSYIRTWSSFYFGRVDFEHGLFMTEMQLSIPKGRFRRDPSAFLMTDAQVVWAKINPDQTSYFESNFRRQQLDDIFRKNCVLYFPSNRFEDPAWLNEQNLNAQAAYMYPTNMQQHSDRKLVNISALHENQNWLLDLAYDSTVLYDRFDDTANRIYEIANQLARAVAREKDVRIGMGRRHDRRVSIVSETVTEESGKRSTFTSPIAPLFQLSAGETSLLNLFLSILRDFDLSRAPFRQASDVRGIVVVDEIDLHLHSVHQYEVLPELIKMFPNVQFVVTTHSPLFVLGMQRAFGEDGFGLYRLPQGKQISPEEFSEFGDAYRAFTETVTFSNDMRTAIERAQKPIVFHEGTTDQKYIEKASELLDRKALLEYVELRDGGGSGNLAKIWKDSLLPLTEMLPNRCCSCSTVILQERPTGKVSSGNELFHSRPRTPLEKVSKTCSAKRP